MHFALLWPHGPHLFACTSMIEPAFVCLHKRRGGGAGLDELFAEFEVEWQSQQVGAEEHAIVQNWQSWHCTSTTQLGSAKRMGGLGRGAASSGTMQGVWSSPMTGMVSTCVPHVRWRPVPSSGLPALGPSTGHTRRT